MPRLATGRKCPVESAFASLRSALCVLALPLLGLLVDAIGSRKSMFIQPGVLGIRCILYLVLTNLKSTFHPGLLLIAAPITAVGGSMGGAFLVSSTYIAEVTPEKTRTLRLTFLDAFFYFAVALFAFVSGFILLRFGYTGMYATSLNLTIVNLVYIRFFVPDPRSDQHEVLLKSGEHSKKDEKRVASSDTQKNDQMNLTVQAVSPACQPTFNFKAFLSKNNPCSYFKKLAVLLRREKQSAAVVALLASSFMSILSWNGEISIIVLYLKARILYFDSLNVGYILAVQSLLCATFGHCIVNIILQRCYAFRDVAIITVSLAAHAIYLMCLGFSTSKLMIYLIQLLCSTAALDAPTL